MKISIIVPVYNAEKYLDKLIESVLEQDYKDYEIVFVDDGSTDKSPKILKDYAKKYKQIAYYHKENSGPGETRKVGFEKSTGDLLFFVDADDWLNNNKVLSTINNIFTNNNIDLLVFNRKIMPQEDILIPLINTNIEEGIHSIDEINTCLIRGSLGLKILKKDILDSSMFVKSSNHEDFYTTYSYLDKCNNFYYINEHFYIINRYPENISLTKGYDVNKRKAGIDVTIDLYNKLKHNNLKNSVSIELFNMYYHYYYGPYRNPNEEALKEKSIIEPSINKAKEIIKKSNIKDEISKRSKDEQYAYYKYIKKNIFKLLKLKK